MNGKFWKSEKTSEPIYFCFFFLYFRWKGGRRYWTVCTNFFFFLCRVRVQRSKIFTLAERFSDVLNTSMFRTYLCLPFVSVYPRWVSCLCMSSLASAVPLVFAGRTVIEFQLGASVGRAVLNNRAASIERVRWWRHPVSVFAD